MTKPVQALPSSSLPSLRLLDSDQDIQEGVEALRRACRFMCAVHDLTGDPPLRRYPAGFEGLARIIAGQQLSIASAEAIWRRLTAAVVPFEAPVLAALPESTLQGAGLSRGKIRTLRAVAAAMAEGLDLEQLAHAPEARVHESLTPLPGIGPWTVDIFLLFCAGRADAWAAGDLGLQAGVQLALGLETRPDVRETASIAERWRPWRGVAARLLWAYYGRMKSLQRPQRRNAAGEK